MQAYVPKADPAVAKAQAVLILLNTEEQFTIDLMNRLQEGRFSGTNICCDFFAGQARFGDFKSNMLSMLGFEVKAGHIQPIEQFTFNIALGDTMETNSRARELYGWCEEVLELKALERRPTLSQGSACGADIAMRK